MTLDQLAALLDQLKRPIEEAPRDAGSPRVWACTNHGLWHMVGDLERSKVFGWCGYTPDNWRIVHLTHFLPLPAPGPVEFEVVPVGRSERAYLSGLETGAEVARLEGEE